MTQHQDAAHRVARFLEGYARMRQLDQDVITGVAVGDDDEPRDLLVQDLKILCYTAFNTPSTPESLAQDAADASQLVTDQYEYACIVCRTHGNTAQDFEAPCTAGAARHTIVRLEASLP